VNCVLYYLLLYGVVGSGLLWDVSTLCAVVPPAGLYGVVGTRSRSGRLAPTHQRFRFPG
jgi:hypothetical protein